MSDMVGCEWKGSRVLESAAYFACFPIATIRRDVGKFFKLFFRGVPLFSSLCRGVFCGVQFRMYFYVPFLSR